MFFRSFVPNKMTSVEFQNYAFSKAEIVNICKESLSILFRDYDQFFEQLTVNFAKTLYRICRQDWQSDCKIDILRIERSFAQANDQDVKMMNLLFGTVGLLSLEKNSDILSEIFNRNETGDKLSEDSSRT